MRKSDAICLLVGPVWLGILAVAWASSWRYESEPGDRAPAPSVCPTTARTGLAPGRALLLMFVREDCPCTLASVQELDRLLSGLPKERAPRCSVVFVGRAAENGGDGSPLWRRVGEIPGVERVRDADRSEAVRFEARTSGEILAYGPRGGLVFHGGLTVSRGHEGESVGHVALREWLLGRRFPRGPDARPPVFGCPLNDPD